jgi:hypothetical protein
MIRRKTCIALFCFSSPEGRPTSSQIKNYCTALNIYAGEFSFEFGGPIKDYRITEQNMLKETRFCSMMRMSAIQNHLF